MTSKNPTMRWHFGIAIATTAGVLRHRERNALQPNPDRSQPAFPKGVGMPPGNHRPHAPGCTCAVHDRRPVQCPMMVRGVRCEVVKLGKAALKGHITVMHKRRVRRFAPVLVPDGHGYLTAVLRDPGASKPELDLSNLPRFARMLAGSARPRRNSKRWKVAQQAFIEEMLERPDDLIPISTQAHGKLLATIGQLALRGGVDRRIVIHALLCYGLEHLAKELRAYRTAPLPHTPPPVVKTAESKNVRLPQA